MNDKNKLLKEIKRQTNDEELIATIEKELAKHESIESFLRHLGFDLRIMNGGSLEIYSIASDLSNVAAKIISCISRPAFYIIGDSVDNPANNDFLNGGYSKVQEMYDLIRQNEYKLLPAIQATGMIRNEPRGPVFGTGLAIGQNLLLTAYHVVKDLLEDDGTINGLVIDLIGEYNIYEQDRYQLKKLINKSEKLDVAFVEIHEEFNYYYDIFGIEENPYGVELGVLGYPVMNDGGTDAQDFANCIGGADTLATKRIHVGELKEYKDGEPCFYHNCITADGNSGGPVVEINSGNVVGIHIKKYSGVKISAIKNNLFNTYHAIS